MGVGNIWARAALYAGILAGFAYLFVMHQSLGSATMLAFKGTGVWFLAIYAALNARSTSGWLITGVMAMGSLGDVLVEQNLELGAGAFIVGHILAAWLYFKNRRRQLSPSQKWLAIIVVPAVLLISWILTQDGLSLLYSLFLAVMASLAWTSLFSRYRVGIGAMLFVLSDLMIFARGAEWISGTAVDLAIWAFYFAGQVMIVVGVSEVLAKRAGEASPT
jgi:uncharacterized membrane protein YhhN